MPKNAPGQGRPRKPNEMHLNEGTARKERGTDVVMQIEGANAVEPRLRDLTITDREGTFTMFKDWVIAATGAARIDEILLSMMVDQLEIYAQAKADNDIRLMGSTIDRFHKMAREFGMTPATRSHMVKVAMKESKDFDFTSGPGD